MGKQLLATHRDRVTKEEFHRITLWLDCNSNELGSWHQVEKQKAGEIVYPLMEYDPNNPTFVEHDRPTLASGETRANAGAVVGNPRIRASVRGNQMHIVNPGDAGVIRLYNLAGRAIVTKPVPARGRITVDVAHLGTGFLYLEFVTKDHERRGRLLTCMHKGD
jgi:hypothetical protein